MKHYKIYFIFLWLFFFSHQARAHQRIITHSLKIEVNKDFAKILFHLKIPIEQAAMLMSSLFPQIANTNQNEILEQEQIAEVLFKQERETFMLFENTKNLFLEPNYQIKSKWPKTHEGIIEIMALGTLSLSSLEKHTWKFEFHNKQRAQMEIVFDASYEIELTQKKPFLTHHHLQKKNLPDNKKLIQFIGSRNESLTFPFHKIHKKN